MIDKECKDGFKMRKYKAFNKHHITGVELFNDKLNLSGHVRVVIFKEALKNLLHPLYKTIQQ